LNPPDQPTPSPHRSARLSAALAAARSAAERSSILRGLGHSGTHYAALGLLFTFLALLSWRRWPDLIVDFGRELYVPWRLAEGELLYRDIVHYYGPLAVTVNSWLFRIFGPGFDTLFWTGLLLLAGFTLALRAFFLPLVGPVAASLLLALFLTGFAFGNFVLIGNYNWVAPYSYDAIYGVYLGFGLLVALARYLADPKPRWLALAGMALGATYLTKPENFLAALSVAAIGALAALWRRHVDDAPERSNRWREGAGHELRVIALWLGGPALAVVAVVNLHFALALGGVEGWTSVHRSWLAVFQTAALTASPTNLVFTGFDQPWANLVKVLSAGLWAAATFGIIGLGTWACGKLWTQQRAAALALGLALLGLTALLVLGLRRDPLLVGPILPVASVALLVWRAWEFAHAARGVERAQRARALLWSAFGLGLLAKMLLNPRVQHYGFFQAMPATLDLAGFLLAELPRLVRARGGSGRLAVGIGVTLVATLCLALLMRAQPLWRIKTFSVGRDGDRIVTHPPQLTPLNRSIEEMRALIAKDFAAARTLLVLPEGVSLNYLFRKPTAVPLFEFVPPALEFYGQDRLLAQLAANPPDLVIVLTRDLREFRVPVFGHDDTSGRRLLDWIEPRYEVVARGGGDPLKAGETGIVLLKRRRF
jgi:hypothetical protein